MLSFVICQLFISAIYSWLNLWSLGYHGVFALILISLWGVSYIACWDLFNLWLYNNNYLLFIFNWIEIGNHILIDFILLGDFLTLILLLIMAVGSFIVTNFVYIELWEDKEGANFLILLIIFLSFMGILVAGGNLMIFYLGWEGIGLTSLFLINFWSERSRGFKASFKVYTINKIGDFLLLIGMCLLMNTLGNLNFYYCEGMSWLLLHYKYNNLIFNLNINDIISFLIFTGGCVKSSQFGFHIWLLEAMEAPLGASALMHSSTLVVAGILLTLRLNTLLELSWVVSTLLVIWGMWTSTFAAITACWQYELKIIMAYSTISSLGFMYCLLGLHAYYEVILYLIIHAFIKIFLFLVVGAIMLHCSGCQDMRWMGGLLNYIPLLWIFYCGGALGLGGLPYWSGYYCKTAGWRAIFYLNNFWNILTILIIINSICTYIYLFRLGILVFGGLKLGHKSIYRVRWQSPLLYIFFTLSLFIILYGGIIWNNLLLYYENVWYLGWYTYYNFLYNLNYILTYAGWNILFFIYLFTFICLILSWQVRAYMNWCWYKSIWNITFIFNLFLIIYIIL